MEKPLVSVVMPVYNGEKYIQRAVDSVFEQKVSLELIVIDDCSVDGTEKVMDKYKSRGEVRYFRNKTNIGVSGSRNRGVREAKGIYVAFLDADDWWEKDKLKKQLILLEKTGSRNLFHRKSADASRWNISRKIYSRKAKDYLPGIVKA